MHDPTSASQPSRWPRIAVVVFSALIFLFSCWYWQGLTSQLAFSTFTERDAARALDLLRGSFPHAGPETTGGGRTPGAFYYYLLSLPMLVRPSLTSLTNFLVLMQAAAGTFLFLLVLRRGGQLSVAVLAFLVFLFAEGGRKYYLDFWNPSFSSLFLIFFLALFLRPPGARWGYFGIAATGFLAGLLGQLHLSYLFLAVGVFLAFETDSWRRGWRTLLSAAAAFLAGFALAYLLFWWPAFLFGNEAYVQDAGSIRLTAAQRLRAVYYWWIPPWQKLTAEDWALVIWVIALVLAKVRRRPWVADLPKGYFWLLASSSVPFVFFLFLAGNGRYSYPFRVVALLGAALVVAAGVSRGRRWPRAVLALAVVAAAANFLLARPPTRLNDRLHFFPGYANGADFQALREHAPEFYAALASGEWPAIALIGLEPSGFSWRLFLFSFARPKAPADSKHSRGWIVFANGGEPYQESTFKELLRSRLPQRFVTEWDSGAISKRGVWTAGRFTVVGYELTEASAFSAPIDTLGNAYLEPLPSYGVTRPSGATLYAARWAHCGSSVLCEMRAEASVEKRPEGRIRLLVDGASLRYGSVHTRPFWTEALVEPVLHISCGAKELRQPLVDVLGPLLLTFSQNEDPSYVRNATAPLRMSFPNPCGPSLPTRLAMEWRSVVTISEIGVGEDPRFQQRRAELQIVP